MGEIIMYVNLFITNMQNQYRMCGRLPNEAIEVYIELLNGKSTRLTRELGVKPRNLEQLRILHAGNLDYTIKYRFINLWFKELLDDMKGVING